MTNRIAPSYGQNRADRLTNARRGGHGEVSVMYISSLRTLLTFSGTR